MEDDLWPTGDHSMSDDELTAELNRLRTNVLKQVQTNQHLTALQHRQQAIVYSELRARAEDEQMGQERGNGRRQGGWGSLQRMARHHQELLPTTATARTPPSHRVAFADPAPPAPPAPPAAALEGTWERHITADGFPYIFNPYTGASHWGHHEPRASPRPPSTSPRRSTPPIAQRPSDPIFVLGNGGTPPSRLAFSARADTHARLAPARHVSPSVFSDAALRDLGFL